MRSSITKQLNKSKALQEWERKQRISYELQQIKDIQNAEETQKKQAKLNKERTRAKIALEVAQLQKEQDMAKKYEKNNYIRKYENDIYWIKMLCNQINR